jgi:fatty acid desaturase
MLTRATRWFLIAAPGLAGILLLIFGTAGATSQAFGLTLIAIAVMVWLWNWFIRMSFDDQGREREAWEREERAREQRLHRQPSQPAPPPGHPPRKLSRRQRRPL